jgi:hypothetical protein
MAIKLAVLQKKIGYFYDLGRAHHKETFNSYNDFVVSLLRATKENNNRFSGFVSSTNQDQTYEREWLDQIGFESHTFNTDMLFHTINESKLYEVLETFEPILAEKLSEEEKLEREYLQKILDLEQREGRNRGELRIGDIVCYDELTSRLSSYLYQKTVANTSDFFQITRCVAKDFYKFRHYSKHTQKMSGSEYHNYTYPHGGYSVENLVLVERFLE